MRILFMFFIGIAIAAQYGCNDSSTGANSTENNSAGEHVTDSNTGGEQQPNRGALGQVVDNTDVAVYGKVVSKNTVYSSDHLRIPHTVVNIEINEVIFGKYEGLGSNIISVRYVGGKFDDGTDREIWASNTPDVAIGNEVVALINEHEDAPCTLTQCAKGLFNITGNKIIADNGAAVIVDDEKNVRYVSKGAQAKGLHQDILSKSSVSNFTALLANLAKSSNSKAISDRVTVKRFDKNQPFVASHSLTTGSVGPTTNEENAALQAKAKQARAKQFTNLSAKDQWEIQAFEANNGSPVLPNTYLGEDQQ